MVEPIDASSSRLRIDVEALGALGSGALQDLLGQDLLTSLYVQILQHPRFREEELELAGATPLDRDQCLEVLAARGMLRRVEDGSWVANAPETALSDHASRLEEQARTVRAATPGLVRLYYESLTNPDRTNRDVGVELLESLDEVNAAMSELFGGTRSSVVSMRTGSPRVRLMLRTEPERVGAPVLNARGQALRIRATFDAGLLEDEDLPDTIAARLRVGDEIRFANTVPFTATSSDSGVTVMDIDDPRGTAVGVRITHPGVSEAIRRVIDDTWVRGVQWTGRGSVGPDRVEPLDARDRDILALMLGGAADVTIARQLKISQRTVERRTRRILELLDATTRFQAGAQAVKRGWI